jgi:hypothetical protein
MVAPCALALQETSARQAAKPLPNAAPCSYRREIQKNKKSGTISPPAVPATLCCKVECPVKPGAKPDDDKQGEAASHMRQGKSEARDGHYTEAASHFSEAMKLSKSREFFSDSERGYLSARRVMSRWWWQIGAYLPPLRWCILHPLRCVFLLLLAMLLALVHKFRQGKGILYYLGKGFQRAFRPSFTGQAYIVSPVKLTDSAEAALFAGTLQLKFKEVLDRLRRDGESLQVNSVPYLSLPVELSNSVLKDAPEVRGFDLGKILQFILGLSRYFRWRVESQIAFIPSAASGADDKKDDKKKTSVAGLSRVSASLFWGWFPYPLSSVERAVTSAYDLEDISFGVAARILGRTNDDFRGEEGRVPSVKSLARGLWFTNEEGFGLFMEALSFLQRFEDEALREVSRLQPLFDCLHNAEVGFRRCLDAYPFDPLPRYYLAIVLAIQNQEVYLSGLIHLKNQFESQGALRALEFAGTGDPEIAQLFRPQIDQLRNDV